jgi:hypothetical protein
LVIDLIRLSPARSVAPGWVFCGRDVAHKGSPVRPDDGDTASSQRLSLLDTIRRVDG